MIPPRGLHLLTSFSKLSLVIYPWIQTLTVVSPRGFLFAVKARVQTFSPFGMLATLTTYNGLRLEAIAPSHLSPSNYIKNTQNLATIFSANSQILSFSLIIKGKVNCKIFVRFITF